VIVQYSRHMGFRFAKSMLGLMVMALAFSTMAPANAVTPGQVCVRTPSGIAFSTTVQWTFNGNSSREIATDANGCANFPHLPQAEISIQTGTLLIPSGQVVLRLSSFGDLVTVDSSGFALLQSATNPPEVKHATITLRTISNRVIGYADMPLGDIQVSNAHEGTEDEMEPWYTQLMEYRYTDDDGFGTQRWDLRRVVTFEDQPNEFLRPFWQDEQGVVNFYYFGDLARDTREGLTYYDPDTNQTITLPADPRSPLVSFTWHDSSLGARKVISALTVTPQVIRLMNRPSITKLPKKAVKFKSGKPVKVTVTLLDSYGKPWKNQWVTGDVSDYFMKKSSKCKLKPKGKTDKKGKVTLTFCPKKSGEMYLYVQTIFYGDPTDFYVDSFQVRKS
jgi:hypothetical protein